MSGLIVVPAAVSQIGILPETVFGVLETGDYRGLLVTDFEATPNGDFAPFTKVSGVKGNFDLGVSGESYDISFSICASTSGDTAAGLGDILAMIFDKDTITGAGPFTHTFTNQSQVSKKSWSLMQKDGNGKTRIFRGVVVNEAVIAIVKTAGIITIEVSAVGFKPDNSATAETIDFEALKAYSPVNSKFTINTAQQDTFETITMTFSMGTEAFHTINDSANPSRITGVTQNLNVAFDGFWNDPDSNIWRDLFGSHLTVSTGNALEIIFGATTTSGNDLCTVKIPMWGLEEETNRSIEQDGTLPQVVNLHAVNQGLLTNHHSVVLLSDVATAFDAF